jgi:MtrB/PioB family decaheme-associated outer membrane protein
VQFGYDGSLFRNEHDAINWNNPGAGPATGRIAESPDNQFHQLSALLGYQLSDRTRLGAKFARGRMTQDQGFLPYSTSAVTPTGNLNGEVDTTLAKLEINSRPMPRLRLDASYTFSDRDNGTPVHAYAYQVTDSPISLSSRLNRPYSFTQNLVRLKAGYRIGNGTDLSGGFDNDKMARTYQQAEQTEDRTIWAKLKLQPLEGLDTTLKISHADRDASAYDPAAYGSPETPLMKAFEMADRARDKAGFDLGWAARDNVNVGLSLDYYKDAYKNMVLGLTEASGFTATPSLNYAINDKMSASLYYTHEKLKSEQAGQEWIGVTPNWVEADTNQTDTVGLSVNWKAIARKLDVGADLVYSEFTGKMRYPGYTDLPEVHSTLTALGVHGTYAFKENMSMRVDYRYEKYDETDWANANVPTVLTLGAAPTNQETHLIFVSVRYAFK